MARPRGMRTDCDRCPKIPRDAPVKHWLYSEDGLSLRNQMAVVHYHGCRAVGRFPDDPLVTRHAAIIRQVEDAADRRAMTGPLNALVRAIGGLLGALGDGAAVGPDRRLRNRG